MATGYRPPFGFNGPQKGKDEDEPDEDSEGEGEEQNPYNWKTQPNKYREWNRKRQKTSGPRMPGRPGGRPVMSRPEIPEENAESDVIQPDIPDSALITMTMGELRVLLGGQGGE